MFTSFLKRISFVSSGLHRPAMLLISTAKEHRCFISRIYLFRW